MKKVLRTLLLGWVLVAPDIANGDDTPLTRELVREYLEQNARVREYYSQIYVRAKFWEKQEASELECARLPSARESILKRELSIWVKGDYSRLDCLGWRPGGLLVSVTWPGAPNGFGAFRYDKDGNWREFYFRRPLRGEELGFTGTKEIALIPFNMFAVGGWWPFERFFLDPRIKVLQVKRLERDGRKLVQVDTENRIYYEESGRLEYTSWFFDTQLSWVPALTQTTERAGTIDKKGNLFEARFDYTLSDSNIPLLKSYEHLLQSIESIQTSEGQCLWLVRWHRRYEVIEISKDVPDSVFQPESLAIPRWQIWKAWCRYYFWDRYALGLIGPPVLFWTQLVLVVTVLAWLAYRRWRRRRLGVIGGSAGDASA